jgi:hypothetical protein
VTRLLPSVDVTRRRVDLTEQGLARPVGSPARRVAATDFSGGRSGAPVVGLFPSAGSTVAQAAGSRGPDSVCYGVMESGRIRARTIAKTPNKASAPSPKFLRVRRVDSIEVVRRLMEGRFLDVPSPERSSVSRFQRM